MSSCGTPVQLIDEVVDVHVTMQRRIFVNKKTVEGTKVQFMEEMTVIPLDVQVSALRISGSNRKQQQPARQAGRKKGRRKEEVKEKWSEEVRMRRLTRKEDSRWLLRT